MTAPQWNQQDREDVEFYCAAAVLLAEGQRSNFACDSETLEWDPEDRIVARLDAMRRVAAVHQVLEQLGDTNTRVLMATYGGTTAPAPVRSTFGDELAPLVMSLATPAELARQETAPKLMADASIALLTAKMAYARAKRGTAVTR